MVTKKILINLFLLTYCIVMSGCEPTQVAEGGIGGTGITNGSIDQFGSIFVNGVEFNTNQADILVNGAHVGEEQLSLGMQVSVKGTVNSDGRTGTAEWVAFNPILEGTIESISAGGNQMIVSGISVETDNLTIFDGVTKDTLTISDNITISGNRDASNTIHATYIRLGYFEGGGVINFGGQSASPSNSGGSSPIPNEDDWTGVEGFVTETDLESKFLVGSSLVIVNDDTSFINGAWSDISVNTHLLVAGKRMADSSIIASRVEILLSPSMSVSGRVTEIDMINGVIYLDGQAITITNTTLMIDRSPQHLRRFGLQQLGVGDQLMIDAFSADGVTVAAKVERI